MQTQVQVKVFGVFRQHRGHGFQGETRPLGRIRRFFRRSRYLTGNRRRDAPDRHALDRDGNRRTSRTQGTCGTQGHHQTSRQPRPQLSHHGTRPFKSRIANCAMRRSAGKARRCCS